MARIIDGGRKKERRRASIDADKPPERIRFLPSLGASRLFLFSEENCPASLFPLSFHSPLSLSLRPDADRREAGFRLTGRKAGQATDRASRGHAASQVHVQNLKNCGGQEMFG